MLHRHRTVLLFGFYSFLSLAFLSWGADRVVRSLQHAFHYLWSPTSGIVVDQIDQWGRFGSRLGDLLRADQRAREFENRWIQERIDFARLKALEEENKRLSDILTLTSPPRFHSTVARVWGRDPSDWFHSLLVKPDSKTVQEGDAVVTVQGGIPVVLGQVRELLPDGKARVILLTDSFSALSAVVDRTGEQGLVEGRGRGKILLNYLFSDSTVQKGDTVVTAGLGDVFPPNILVGQVTKVIEAEGARSKQAVVRPAARLGYVREMLVLSRRMESPQGTSSR